MDMNELELTGRARGHIEQLEDSRVALHRDVVGPFLELRAVAAEQGLDVSALSGFRDFEHQAKIWNRKSRGELPLYDRDGKPLDHEGLTEEEIVDAILLWTAVPGASRHHWGSEIDVYDRARMPEAHRVELLPEDYMPGGVFGHLAEWLDGHLGRLGFFRPYDLDRGGVAPEPWHISYSAVSVNAQRVLNVEIIARAVQDSALMGRQIVLDRLPEIFRRYVANVSGSRSSCGPRPGTSRTRHRAGTPRRPR